jgi:uncharacterized protein (DUF1697 family)
MRYVALLRGINVGGHRKLPMAELRAALDAAGYEDVATYVQSGNVVLTAPKQATARLERALETTIEEAFGFPVGVMVRTEPELKAVVAADPLKKATADPAKHLVLFAAAELDAKKVAALVPDDPAPEAFAVRGRELYVWAENGIGRSALRDKLSDKRLGAATTGRNRRTLEKLLALCAGP